jgi:hypothetical protein
MLDKRVPNSPAAGRSAQKRPQGCEKRAFAGVFRPDWVAQEAWSNSDPSEFLRWSLRPGGGLTTGWWRKAQQRTGTNGLLLVLPRRWKYGYFRFAPPSLRRYVEKTPATRRMRAEGAAPAPRTSAGTKPKSRRFGGFGPPGSGLAPVLASWCGNRVPVRNRFLLHPPVITRKATESGTPPSNQ